MNTIKEGFLYILREIFRKPTEGPNASGVLIKIVWFLRISLFIFGLLEIFTGEKLLGLAILLSVLFLIAPSFFTRSRITDIPLEIEFLLFIIVFFHLIVGGTEDFYGKISYYDNILHFIFPFIISVIGFTITYALFKAGKLRVSTISMIMIVIIVTLGIGAIWEIIEYGNDQLLLPHIDEWQRAQGSSPADANQDTMTDLVNDLLGGVVGAIVASRYVLEAKYNKRLRELLQEIAKHFFGSKLK